MKRRFSPFSSRIIEHDERPESTYKGPQGNLTINVEVKRSFLQEPRGCWKHKFLKKKATFAVKKRFSPFSSRIIEHDKRQGTTYKVPQGNLTINVEDIRPFLQDPGGCRKHKFLKKKANFPVKKRFSPISSRIIEHDERLETTYKGPQGNLTIKVEVKRSFLQDPRGCWKHKFLKKKATFPVKKRFSPISSPIIEPDERPETTYKGPQGNLTIKVEVKRSFLQDPRGCWKHKSLKKKGNHSSEDKVLTYSLLRIIECDNPPGTIQKGPKRITTITVEAIRSFF